MESITTKSFIYINTTDMLMPTNIITKEMLFLIITNIINLIPYISTLFILTVIILIYNKFMELGKKRQNL